MKEVSVIAPLNLLIVRHCKKVVLSNLGFFELYGENWTEGQQYGHSSVKFP